MRKPLTVLQVVPSLEAGGAERATVDIAEALVRDGHRAFVISAGGRMVKELIGKGAHHFTWPVNSKNPLQILKNARRLKHFIKLNDIDIVHARSRAPAWSGYLAAKWAKVPFVTTFHAAYKGRAFFKKMYNGVMAKGARIIAISSFIAQHITENYKGTQKKITIIPRGIDFSVYDPALITEERKKQFLEVIGNPSSSLPLVLVPGRLSPIKGQELVLHALAEVKHPCMAIIVGPDQGRTHYNRHLHMLAEQLRLQKVRFLPVADLPAAYACASLVLSPSQVPEGFGRVPVEAEACGVPVIATALGATSETVRQGETGWLVPKGDIQALAAAIDTALGLTHEQRAAMGEVAKVFVRERFDLKDMCAATLKVYDDVFNEWHR
jgi:glycosyltransferase involved in cell wall biosynthesis